MERFRYIIFIVIPVLTVFMCTLQCAGHAPVVHPYAKKGLFTISNLQSYSHDILPLDGEWEFYWGKLIFPGDFERFNETVHPSYVYSNIPSLWNNRKKEGYSDSGEGFATYRLKVFFSRPWVRYALYIPDMTSAYRLWIGNRLIAQNGYVGEARNISEPQYFPMVRQFIPRENTVEIVIQVSNFHGIQGGIGKSILIGYQEDIENLRYQKIITAVFLFSVILFIGVINVFFSLFFKHDRSGIYFSLFVLVIAVRTLVLSDERIIFLLFPDFDWEIGMKMESLGMFLSLPLFYLYQGSTYKGLFSKSVFWFFKILGAGLLIVVLISPARVYEAITPYYVPILFVGCIYLIFSIFYSGLHRRVGSTLMIIGTCILLGGLIHDGIYEINLIHTMYIIPYCLAVFLFLHSVTLLWQFSRAYEQVRDLSNELSCKKDEIENYARLLEHKVLERTEIIERQKEDLELQIRLASDLQKSLLPSTVPQNDTFDISYEYRPMLDVGGDFLDFYDRHEGVIGAFICDVSGHGVSGAFCVSMVKMALNDWGLHIHNPDHLMEKIHALMGDKIMSHFLSAAAVTIDTTSGEILVARAGHPPVLIVKKDGSIERAYPSGKVMISGVSLGCGIYKSRLYSGDAVIMFTDGIIESRNENNEMLGEEGLTRILSKFADQSSDSVCKGVISELKEFVSQKYSIEDDISLVVIRYCGPKYAEN